MSLSDDNQADVVEAFNSISKYLVDLLNIDNPYNAQMVSQINPTELQSKWRILQILKPLFGCSWAHHGSTWGSQLIRFARVCSHVDYFNNSKKNI